MRVEVTKRVRHAFVAVALVVPVLVATSAASTVEAASPIPDEGLPAAPIAASALVSERTERLAAGVVGMNSKNDSFPNTNIRVAAITEIGNTMYVGGKFNQVEVAATGQRTNQPFLAAFDRTTGAWIDTFRPVLDGIVWDLTSTSDGRLVVAGQFTNVNGAASTAGVALLDPSTGAVDPTWRTTIQLTGSTERALARTVDVEGDFLYVGGNFTRITGTDGVMKNAGRLARVRISTGRVDGSFLPNIDGVVFDVDATADRVYTVGNFYYVNGTWSIGEAALQPANGQMVPGLLPYRRTYLKNTANSYQQAILSLGDDIWQTGAQHNRQVYAKSDYSLIRGWITSPWGDGQALEELGGYVYLGSHANGDTRNYRDATVFPELTGATTSLPVRWAEAYDATVRENVPWYPQIGTEKGEGAWELFGDSTGCLWAGGDFNRGSYDGSVPRYVGGFAKFCAPDQISPAPPTAPTAQVAGTGVNLAWTGSTDDRGGQVRYELLKNDSVVASYISITTFRDATGTAADRYFVRAMDSTGNRSATTRVFTAGVTDTSAPTTPKDLLGTIQPNGDVALTWTASTDDVGVTGYRVLRNGVEILDAPGTTATIPKPTIGDHWYQIVARDAAGNQSLRTAPIKITIVPAVTDTTPPSTPQSLVGTVQPNRDVILSWTASTDDVGVTDYLVFRNGTVIDTVTSPSATIVAPAAGDHWYQVRARDAAGNESFKTSPIKVTIAGADTGRPTTPGALAGAQQPNGDVLLTWTASTDDVGVTGYRVYRNGTIIDTVTGPTATIPTPTPGSHWYQVQALDGAGNESFKTPPIEFVVTGPGAGIDTRPPSTPSNLVAAVGADGDVTLTWTASTDDVGVVDYVVLRNGAIVATATGPTAVIAAPGAGSHWFQVRARDAAGNESLKTPPTRVDI